MFIYQSLDAIDGKQARRTGTSTPLGELFDHGCDSISTGNCLSLILFVRNNLTSDICFQCLLLCQHV